MTPDPDATRATPAGSTRTVEQAKDESTFVPVPSPAPAVNTPPGFVVEKELGVGGMGVVYLARQAGLNRPVALKVVKGGAKVDDKAVIRFLAEAEAVAAIKHPNVVEVYQYGEHAGQPYMALEFCPGGDLTVLVNREAKSSTPKDAEWFRRVADLMAQVADGVNAAHAQGIVHRDLKPHNVFLTADGTPKVADFGLAKRGVGSGLTQTEAVMGTPAYMAPEQAGGGTKFVGPEADVWALGVMLYELCCGSRPIDTAGPLLDAIARVARGQVSQLRTRAAAVPPDLALIAHKCLSGDPRDRYPTASELAADLRNWRDGKPISARPAGVVELAVKWAKRNKRLAVMGLAVLVTMAAATAVSLGFGLEANQQAGFARGEQAKADVARQDAVREKNDAVTARVEAQRALAKSLLAPVVAHTFADHSPVARWPGDTEQEAMWELAVGRRGPVGNLLLEQATDSPLGSRQLNCRADFLLHAAVGLDRAARERADGLLARRLRDADRPLDQRRDLAVVVCRVGPGPGASGRPAAESAVALLAEATEKGTRGTHGPNRPPELTWVEKEEYAGGLATACQHLPPEVAAGVLAAALERVTDPGRSGVLVAGLSAVCDRLPAAAAVCRPVAAALAASLKAAAARTRASVATAPADSQTSAAPDYLTAHGRLAAVCRFLPAGEANAVCGAAADDLMSFLSAAALGSDRAAVVGELAALIERLSPAKAAEVRAKGVAALAAAAAAARQKPTEGRPGLVALAGVVRLLPAGETAKELEEVFAVLSASLGERLNYSERQPLVSATVAVGERLPADTVAPVLAAALVKTTDWVERRHLATGLGGHCARLPAERAAELCRPAAKQLAAVLSVKRGQVERPVFAEALVAVARWLPAAEAAAVCEPPAEVVLTCLASAKPMQRQWETFALLTLCERLPPERALHYRRKAAEALALAGEKATPDWAVADFFHAKANAGALDQRDVAVGLPAVAAGLPPAEAAEAYAAAAAAQIASAERGPRDSLVGRWARTTPGAVDGQTPRRHPRMAAAGVAGGVALHPPVLPQGSTVPQRLVELLKHPLCVGEARRATLDALEFVFDRSFADLWAFVSFAEREHPELDLLTPPKRPGAR